MGAALVRNKKEAWSNLPVSIGSYSFDSYGIAEKMVEALQTFHFREEWFRRHDPEKKYKVLQVYTISFGRIPMQVSLMKNREREGKFGRIFS